MKAAQRRRHFEILTKTSLIVRLIQRSFILNLLFFCNTFESRTKAKTFEERIKKILFQKSFFFALNQIGKENEKKFGCNFHHVTQFYLIFQRNKTYLQYKRVFDWAIQWFSVRGEIWQCQHRFRWIAQFFNKKSTSADWKFCEFCCCTSFWKLKLVKVTTQSAEINFPLF